MDRTFDALYLTVVAQLVGMGMKMMMMTALDRITGKQRKLGTTALTRVSSA
jgi:hypothetical protein